MFSFLLPLLTFLVVTLGQEPRPERPIDCQHVMKLGETYTGIYTIYPSGSEEFPVRCDMATDNGGWTVIQRRVGDSDFYKEWLEYDDGFGDLESNFWLGNKQIRALVSQGWYELRIDMVGPGNEKRYAHYDVFSISHSKDRYKLTLGKYSGDAGDSMTGLNGVKFTTKDQDYDSYKTNCAVVYTGAWWYKACHTSNLNGDYGNTEGGKGITWKSLTEYNKSLKQVDMKIRRWSKIR